jgi:O-antigen/teichoic acid export membrane protein
MTGSERVTESLKSILKSSGLFIVGRFTKLPIAFISQVILARYLLSERYGILAQGLAVLEILSFLAALGLQEGISRFIPIFAQEKREDKVRGAMAWAHMFTLVLGTCLAVALAFSSPWIGGRFFKDPLVVPVLKIIAVALPLFALQKITQNCFRGLKRTSLYILLYNLFAPLSRFACIAIVAIMGLGLLALTWGYVAVFAIVALIGVLVLVRTREFPRGERTDVRGVRLELFRFSWPLFMADALWLVLGWTDILMLGFFLPSEAVGTYRAAIPVARFITLLVRAFSFLYMPVVAEMFARRENESTSQVYQSTSKWTALLSFPIFATMALFAPFLVHLIYGAEYAGSASILSVLSIGYFVHGCLGLSGLTLSVYDMNKVKVVNVFIALATNIVLNVLLIPRMGSMGAAVATVISFVLMNVLNYAVLRARTGLSPFNRRYWVQGAVLLAAAGISYVIVNCALSLRGIISVFAFLVLWTLLTVLALVRLRTLDTYDRLILGSMRGRLARRNRARRTE